MNHEHDIFHEFTVQKLIFHDFKKISSWFDAQMTANRGPPYE